MSLYGLLKYKYEAGEGVYLPHADAVRITLTPTEVADTGASPQDLRFYRCFPSGSFIHYTQFPWCDVPHQPEDRLKSSNRTYFNDPRTPEHQKDPLHGQRRYPPPPTFTYNPKTVKKPSREFYNLQRGGRLYDAPTTAKRVCRGRNRN